MSKPFWLKTKFDASAWQKCDDCNTELQGTEWWWNPNKRASKKRICTECKEDRDEKTQRNFEAYQDRLRGARMPT